MSSGFADGPEVPVTEAALPCWVDGDTKALVAESHGIIAITFSRGRQQLAQ